MKNFASRVWPDGTIRLFGVLNVFFVGIGLFLLSQSVLLFWVRPAEPFDAAYFAEAYYASTAINLCFLLGLLFTAYPLWQREQRGLWLCNLVFACEIVYILGRSIIGDLAFSPSQRAAEIGMSVAQTDGIGSMGIALQMLSGYPVIALVVLNLAYRKLRQANLS